MHAQAAEMANGERQIKRVAIESDPADAQALPFGPVDTRNR